jgi:hypothetical protein
MGITWFSVTLAFLWIDYWNRMVILKGCIGWGIFYSIYRLYPKLKSIYGNYKKQNNGNHKIENNNIS